MVELTKDQDYVFKKVMERLGGGNSNNSQFSPDFKYITIGGFAGTGKTFLISIIRNEIYNKWKRVNVAFVTFTGKASSVLSLKLEENNSIFDSDSCSTIHSLIYKPELKYDLKTKKMVINRWIKKPKLDFDLIIIDEASMVNGQIWNDLVEYNIPIIAVGDHGQLPPIGDQFNLMMKPNYVLMEIKRQALDNPIIRLSQDIRNGIDIPFGFYDKNNHDVFKLPWDSNECRSVLNSIDFLHDDVIVLCGFNKTRVAFNKMVRSKYGFTNDEPYPGEKIIFLKNNYMSKVLNGMLGKVLFFMYEAKNVYELTVSIEGYEHPYSGLVFNGCFGKEKYDDSLIELQDKKYKRIIKNSNHGSIDLCDFGYAITTHKSQGSEFKKVICFIEGYWDEEYMRKFKYTAVTRAKEKLFLITK